jgi:hypothetical protein
VGWGVDGSEREVEMEIDELKTDNVAGTGGGVGWGGSPGVGGALGVQ